MTLTEALSKLRTPGRDRRDAALIVENLIRDAIRRYLSSRKDRRFEEDIRQEAFLLVLKALRSERLPLENESATKSYVYRIAINAAATSGRETAKGINIAAALKAASGNVPGSADGKSGQGPATVATGGKHERHLKSLAGAVKRAGNLAALPLPSRDFERVETTQILKLLERVAKHAIASRAERWRAGLEHAYDIAVALYTKDVSMEELLIERGDLAADADESTRRQKRNAEHTAQKRFRKAMEQACDDMVAQELMPQYEAETVRRAIAVFRRNRACQSPQGKTVNPVRSDS